MKELKADRRVRRTRAILRESLLTLLKEKPITKITPTELCRTADINRNTFYSHFDSVDDLLESIEHELFENIHRSFGGDNIESLMKEVCQAIYNDRDLCRVLLSKNGNKSFLRDLIASAHDMALSEWRTRGIRADDEEMEQLYIFAVNGSVAVIQNWIQGEDIKKPGEIASFIMTVIYSGLGYFLN